MRTVRSAAELLAAAGSREAVERLARTLGGGLAVAVDDDGRGALGLGDLTGGIAIARGAGALRFLLVPLPPDEPPRIAVVRIASRIAPRAPHHLWLVIGWSASPAVIGLATWSGDTESPRIRALVVNRDAVVDSDADTLRAMMAASAGVDVAVHARWNELLGREGLSRRFYRALAGSVEHLAGNMPGRASAEHRRELALLCASRLLFLSFLEAKGWLDGDHGFLLRCFHETAASGRGVHRRFLLPLFFGTLNTPPARRAAAARDLGRIPFLNGGLFTRTPLERRHRELRFEDHALGSLFGDVLARFRFTSREDSASWSEAAIDPEMLGRAFENLMAGDERRASGSFYTPQVLVERVTERALVTALADAPLTPSRIRAAMDGILDPELRPWLRRRLDALRLLDPACGSGAFLVHALEVLARLRAAAGDLRDPGAIRRDLLARAIFGVDRNPIAVWLCELRLWLAAVIDTDAADPMRVPPLPNLDHHIVAGDALAGGHLGPGTRLLGGSALGALRERYSRAVGHRKATLGRVLDREERRFALLAARHARDVTAAHRRDLLAALRSRDLFGSRPAIDRPVRMRLDTLRHHARDQRRWIASLARGAPPPFSFAARFPDVAAAGGFGIVIGNPPWVRLHRIPSSTRAALRRDFRVFRDAGWTSGATRAGAGSGFAGQIDLAALFVERSFSIVSADGVISLLLPAKLWHSLAGGGVRRLIREESGLVALEDWSTAPALFDAATYPSLLVARRGSAAAAPAELCVHRPGAEVRWMAAEDIALDATPGAPWLILPSEQRRAFDRLARAGPPLADTAFGRPLLGVKCGCNDAFVVRADERSNGIALVSSGDRRGSIERALLRPVLRGDAVRPWKTVPSDERLIWTHGSDGDPLPALPPLAGRWMRSWRSTLEHRSDARGARRWWALFRTEAAATGRARVVWPDIGRAPRALVLRVGDPTVPLNSCYVLPCADETDALALAALMNSPVAASWLAAIAEPARGGYHRYLAWTVGLLPMPADWPRARALLAPLARGALAGRLPPASALVAAACRAYRIRERDIAPLLAWNDR